MIVSYCIVQLFSLKEHSQLHLVRIKLEESVQVRETFIEEQLISIWWDYK